jgi:lysozyme
MQISNKGLELIKRFEGYSDRPYLCAAGKPTISYGLTYYPNGKKVTMKDSKITKEQGDEMFYKIVSEFAADVLKLVKSKISVNQLNALTAFSYNVGMGNFQKSTLLKLVNINPNDGNIAKEFLKWNKAAGKELKGLTNRRIAESALYFTK